MEKLSFELKRCIELIRKENIQTDEGMDSDLFLLISGLIPLVNVDLMITNDKNQILLARRNDMWYQDSWYIPGGCMYYGEEFLECVNRTIQREIGLNLIVEEKPITVRNVIRGIDASKEYPRERGHNVAILFRCSVKGSYELNNDGLTEADEGYLKWFDYLPQDFMEIQHVYDDVLSKWIKDE